MRTSFVAQNNVAAVSKFVLKDLGSSNKVRYASMSHYTSLGPTLSPKMLFRQLGSSIKLIKSYAFKYYEALNLTEKIDEFWAFQLSEALFTGKNGSDKSHLGDLSS